ncbi:MAG TPA: type II toxin-antitoxin system death-on-curing family toxin [Edaphobacter sp.]
MTEPRWISKASALAIHNEQLTEHGGSNGVRNEGLLESDLGKPRNVFAYEPDCDFARLAASYAYGIARNHPFVDGNERTALVVAETFLQKNGIVVVVSHQEKYLTFLHLAESMLSEDELAAWFQSHAKAL